MHRNHIAPRGQVLIIFVFAVVGLIGMTGIAIDGGNIYSDRRHAQNAADTAALAGSLMKINKERGGAKDCGVIEPTPSPCGSVVLNTAKDMAAKNGYHGDLVHDTVEVHIPPIDGPYSAAACGYSCNPYDYIQVIISTNVDTWFAKVLGIQQLHNRVEAVARATYSPKESLYGGNSLVALRPHSGPGCGMDETGSGQGGGDVYLGGSSGLKLDGGGIFVNSDNPDCALKITNTCPAIQLTNGATVTGLGGQFDGCEPPILEPATEPYPYPPEEPPVEPIPPDACNHTFDPGIGLWNPVDKTFHFSPGHYMQLPLEKDSTLEPGVYCVENLIKTTNSYKFYGDGVFMYVRPGGEFRFNGGTIQLVAPGMVFPGKTQAAPVSPETEPYKGFLIYVDENNWEGSPSGCIVNGGSDTVLRGVIYAPHCNVTIDGGSGTFGITAQVISYTLNLQGSAVLNFIYDATLMPASPEQNLTGLLH